ncbi:MAG: helix-turn-helix domain-containing protein [Alphaproteobacteria bacterium]|nr:helix-turn-helix domain-containing protein [Alphaproteobacteria bacterium]
MKPDPHQIRAARALLNWTLTDLAAAAGMTKDGVRKIEQGLVVPQARSLSAIAHAFQSRGVEFLENSGVRFQASNIEVYEGVDRFDDFSDFLYEHLKQVGGDVCISAVEEWRFALCRKDPVKHYLRMKELKETGQLRSFRVIATESDFHSGYGYAKYKWQPRHSAMPTAFYSFGNCFALIVFEHKPSPYVVLHKSGPLAEAYRSAFEVAWQNAKPPPAPNAPPESGNKIP